MNRIEAEVAERAARVPRRRGDEPKRTNIVPLGFMRSPQARG